MQVLGEVRVTGEDGEPRPLHYTYVFSIDFRLAMRVLGVGDVPRRGKEISDNIVDYGGWGTCLEDGVDRDALVDHLLVEIIPGLGCMLEGLGLRLGA